MQLCKERKKIIPERRLIGLQKNELYYECKECNDESYKSINGLNKKFPNTYRFCNEDINKFVLFLRKGVYPYEYTGSQKKVPPKEAFYSKLHKEGITDEEYAHAQ